MKLPVLTKKVKIIGLSAGIGLLVLAGSAMVWLTHQTPEDRLYSALAKDTPFGHLAVQENVGGETITQNEIHATLSGEFKGKGAVECSAPSSFGTIHLKLSLLLDGEKDFVRFDTLAVSGGNDATVETALNKYFGAFTNAWILIDDQESNAVVLRTYGVAFGNTGAVSNKLSGEDMAKKLRASNAIKLVKSEHVTENSKPAVKYSIEVRRSNYDNFMDSIAPELDTKNKERVLNAIFTDDTENVVVVVDKATNQVIYETYSMDNICAEFLSSFDPDFANALAPKTTMKAYYKPDDNLSNVAKPSKYLTSEEFSALLRDQALILSKAIGS